MWWNKRIYRDPEPKSFVSLSAQNGKVVRVHWVHLLCNNFNSLPSSSSAIITAWVIRQSSNNEKLEKQKKSCMSVVSKPWDVQPSLFAIWSSGRPLTKVIRLTKKSQNYRYHLDLADLSYSSPKTSSSCNTSL